MMAMADTARMFGKRIEASQETTNQAAEIRLRAERRLGVMPKENPKNTGDKGSKITGSKRVPVKEDPPDNY